VTGQGSTVPLPTTSTTQVSPVTQQAVTTVAPGGESLPRTGSNPTSTLWFGGSCLAVGAALAMRKRNNWNRK
jgi:LPXTG-motif cell wall-anchored protein